MSMEIEGYEPSKDEKAKSDAYTLIRFNESQKEVDEIRKDKARFKAALEQIKKISKDDKKRNKDEMERIKARESGINSLLKEARRK